MFPELDPSLYDNNGASAKMKISHLYIVCLS
jgi:hypothetical protein